jgi:NitT/TauT family transport system ATP-binding protein
MDEPFGALDAQTRQGLQAELSRIHATVGATIVFVTHSIDEATFLSDQTVVLTKRPGRIAGIVKSNLPRPRVWSEIRTHRDFLAQREEVARLLRG